MERDRNLLFGIFAVQIRGVTPKQIVEAGAAWATDPSRSLSARLVEQGTISASDVDLINRLVDAAVQAHQGDASQALERLGGEDQVNRTFCGSIVLRPSGGLETRPMASDSFLGLDQPVPILSAVEEYPGRYSQVSEYGRGGMGRVLLVHDEHMGREVALKELLLPKSEWPGPGESPARESAAYMARFLQEARLTGKLEHPGIVPVYELGRRQDGTLYYTMKLVRGKTLAKALKECRSLKDRLGLLSNFVDMCQALAYAHSRGVIHRDIKPANVMVGSFGETIVLDWGLAKARGIDDVQGEELESTIRNLRLKKSDPAVTPFETRAGEAVGTPHYMSPEQAAGRIKEVDERSDVYALGVVLYELLTGRVPHEGGSIEEVLWAVANGEPPAIEKVAPDAPPELVQVCMKALRRDPAKRYPTAGDLARDIKNFQTGSIVSAYSYTPAEMIRRFYSRHRALVNTVAAAATLLLLLGLLSYVSIFQARNRERAQRLVAEAAQRAAESAKDAEATARATSERQTYLAQLRLAESYLQHQQMRLANEALDAAPAVHRDWVWGYLRNEAQPSLFTVRSEKSAFLWATYDPAAKYIVGIRSAETPGLWNAEDGSHLLDFEGQTAIYHASAFSDDGTLFAAVGENGVLDVWTVASGKKLLHTTHAGEGLDVRFSPDAHVIWAAYETGQIVEWDVAGGLEKRAIEVGGPVQKVLHARPANLLITANTGTKKVTAYDLATFAPRWTAEGDQAWLSPDGATVVAATGSTVAAYDSATGALKQALEGHDDRLFHVSFSADGQQVLTSCLEGGLRLYRLGKAAPEQIWGLNGPVASAFFADGGARVVACAASNRYTIYDTASGATLAEFGGDNSSFPYAELASDDRRLLSCSAFHSFQVFDVVKPKGIVAQRVEPVKSTGGVDIACAFDAQRVAVLWSGALVGVYSLPGLEPLAKFPMAENIRSQVGISDDGTKVLYWPDATHVAIGDVATQKNTVVYAGHNGPIACTALARDGATAASADESGEIHLWNTAGGETTHRIKVGMRVNAMTFAISPPRIVAGCTDGKVRVYDAETEALTQTIDAHVSPVMALALQRSQELLATAGRDGSVSILEFTSGVKKANFATEEGFIPEIANILSLHFGEGDNYLATRMNSESTLAINTEELEVSLQRLSHGDSQLLKEGFIDISPQNTLTFFK